MQMNKLDRIEIDGTDQSQNQKRREEGNKVVMFDTKREKISVIQSESWIVEGDRSFIVIQFFTDGRRYRRDHVEFRIKQ